MPELVFAIAMLLAFVNGANDNIKATATLYGAGVLTRWRAITLATFATGVGSLASIAIATTLVRAFSGKGLIPDAALTPALLAAVGAGAALTVLLATRLGFPVSTTHALVGGLLGAGWVAAGRALDLAALGGAFALPLLLGPLLAVGLALLLLRGGQRLSSRLGVGEDTCVCVGEPLAPLAATPDGHLVAHAAGGAPAWPPLEIAPRAECAIHSPGRRARLDVHTALGASHLFSACLVGFARGLNDTPKILGLVVGAAVVSPASGALAIAAAMALGGLLASRRVSETLAHKITPMTESQGLAGNVTTSLLVIGASRFGVPVSTTHVATGGIFGIGLSGGELRWRTAGEVLLAWFTTLPLAALLAALFAWGML